MFVRKIFSSVLDGVLDGILDSVLDGILDGVLDGSWKSRIALPLLKGSIRFSVPAMFA